MCAKFETHQFPTSNRYGQRFILKIVRFHQIAIKLYRRAEREIIKFKFITSHIYKDESHPYLTSEYRLTYNNKFIHSMSVKLSNRTSFSQEQDIITDSKNHPPPKKNVPN